MISEKIDAQFAIDSYFASIDLLERKPPIFINLSADYRLNPECAGQKRDLKNTRKWITSNEVVLGKLKSMIDRSLSDLYYNLELNEITNRKPKGERFNQNKLTTNGVCWFENY